MSNSIELKNLSKTFFDKKNINVLKKINFKFQLGKIYSIMGPSGSGKSTLLNLISLIDKPTSGSIKYLNKTIDFNNNENNDIFRANNIGIIYQQDNLLTDFTALENVYLACLASGLDKNHSKLKAVNILKQVGLANRIDHYPSELSGGEKQRVSISRALVNEPKIILADEPTGNLDPATSLEIMNLFKEINNNGTTVIIATHDYEIISKFPAKTIRIEKDRFFELSKKN